MAKVTAKKKCCRDKPRCKSCPVVLKRLSDGGHLVRLDLRTYKVTDKPSKSDMSPPGPAEGRLRRLAPLGGVSDPRQNRGGGTPAAASGALQ